VGDPDGARCPVRGLLETGRHDVGHQPVDLTEVRAGHQRQVQGGALEAQPTCAGEAGRLPQPAGGEAVPAHRGHPFQHHAGAVAQLAERREGQHVVDPAEGVHHPGIARGRIPGPPRGEHQHVAVEPLGHVGDLGVGPHGDRVDAEPLGPPRQPPVAEPVAVALHHRHQARPLLEHPPQVGTPPVAVDGEGDAGWRRLLAGGRARREVAHPRLFMERSNAF
jgi:hypothetical protein